MNPSTPQTWMMTIGLELTNSQKINMFNLGKYLEIQSVPSLPIQVPVIIGIKYNQTTSNSCIIKGNYKVPKPLKKKATKSIKNYPIGSKSVNFKNQVSLQIQYLHHTINVKIFQNGNMHMSGIKEIKHAIIIRQFLVQEFNNLHTQYSDIILKIENNVQYIDSDNFLYAYVDSEFKVIGYKTQQNTFCINGSMYIYDINHQHYYSTTMVRKKRVVLSINGVVIGYKKLVLNGINTRIYTNHKSINDTGDSLYIGDILVGVYTMHLDSESKVNNNNLPEPQCNSIIIKYCKKILSELASLDPPPLESVKIYNMFLKYNLGQRIDKNILSNIFKQSGLITRSFIDQSKVELTFKYGGSGNGDSSIGICNCSSSTCTCKHINFIFFETGTVSVYGIKHTLDFIYIDQVNQLINNAL
jgi:hypothetical protein